MIEEATVVGGGISGVACAGSLVAAGVPVHLRERSFRLGGRMASRTLRRTGTAQDGRVVDIGASYFTVSDPTFRAVVDDLEVGGIVRPWTNAFHVHDGSDLMDPVVGPMRYAAPLGLRSVVEALSDGVRSTLNDPITDISVDAASDVTIDGEPVPAAAMCMPYPQAERICAELPRLSGAWESVISVTLVFARRWWPDIDGVFVNDESTVSWIADDGKRRGDDAPVLVAHVKPYWSDRFLYDVDMLLPTVVPTVQRLLGFDVTPLWTHTHRWTYAKPVSASKESFWLHDGAPLGLASDAWAGGPRVEAAWLSGHRLGAALAARLG